MNKYFANYHFYTNYRNINSISQHLNDTNSYFNHCYRHREKKKKKKKKNKRMSGTSTFGSSFCIISTLEYHM